MRKNILKIVNIFILALLVPVLIAEEVVSNFPEITTGELKPLIEAKKDIVLIDARSVEEYEEAHIIKAINIPINDWETYKSKLPKDKKLLFVTYCNGVQCGKSIKMAKKLSEIGYKNIKVYREGFPVWEEVGLELVKGPGYGKKIETNKLTPDELNKLEKTGDGNIIVVDVRDAKEYLNGHIPGAINVPVSEFAIRSGEIAKSKKVVVYCNTGSRSYLAYKKLVNMAYKDIHQVLFAEWKNSDFPIVTN